MITLPTKPTGDQFEDFVAGALRALGYFIETKVILREGKKEVLELDVVATPVGGSSSDREFIEAKKDGISFPNMFKLYGQRMYLDIPSACLVSHDDVEPLQRQVYDAKGKELGIRVCCHKVDDEQIQQIAPQRNDLTAAQSKIVAPIAWYLQIGKRMAQAAMHSKCKKHKGDELFERVRQYTFEVHASFFGKTALDRAQALYSAYFDSPKLTGELVQQLADERGVDTKAVWNEVNDTSQHLWLQHQMLLEWSARIAILKHALDDIVERGGAPLPTFTVRFGSKKFQIQKHNVPPRFVAGLKTLHDHPHSLKLPYLYQCFIELFGGFIFPDSDEELELLETLTGVPKKKIVPSLELLDEFFAPASPGGSMFYTVRGEMKILKMVPALARGVGSFMRSEALGIKKYDVKYPKMGWLLAKWHNAAYAVLEPELKASESDVA